MPPVVLHTKSYRDLSPTDKQKRDDAWFSQQHTGEKPAPPPAKKWGTVKTGHARRRKSRKAKKTRRHRK